MSNTTSEHPVTPAAISVGSDGSPDQVSRHTPEDNARNLGDDSFLPEILQPIYDSEEQERKVKLAVVLAILDQLYAATAGKWILVKVGRESWIAATTQIVGNIVCEPPDEWENSMLNWPDNCAWIIAAHNHYPTLREEIKRLREENVRLSDLAVQVDSMKAEIAGDAENYRSIIAAGEQYAKKLQDELTHLSNLCRRWNVALSKFCAGSEFVDDPERVASGIQEAITFAESIGRVKGQKERDRQLKEAREALKVSLRWLNHHEDGYDWCPRCIVEEALARIEREDIV